MNVGDSDVAFQFGGQTGRTREQEKSYQSIRPKFSTGAHNRPEEIAPHGSATSGVSTKMAERWGWAAERKNPLCKKHERGRHANWRREKRFG